MNSNVYRVGSYIKNVFTNRELLHNIRDFDHQQWFPSEKINKIQWDNIKNLLKHAYASVAFYRERFDKAGFKPEDIRSYTDFQKIPVLTKTEIRSNLEWMVAEGIDRKRLKKSFTGGSTGVPLAVYHDTKNNNLLHAVYINRLKWLGIKYGDRIAYVWGLNKLNAGALYSKQKRGNRFLNNQILLDAFNMTEENMFEFAKIIKIFKPKLIISYVSAMYEFAKYIKEQKVFGIRPIAIELTAESTSKEQKLFIEDTFNAPVFDQYGSCEIYWYASECEKRNGLHVFSHIRYLECLDNSGLPTEPNVPGKVVVTDLVNYVAPIIRYENGDMSSFVGNGCQCGRGFPLINKVRGRISDMIIISNGTHIHGEYFTHVLYDLASDIMQFQIHQRSISEIDFLIVVANKERIEYVSQMLKNKFDYLKTDGMNIQYIFVDNIPKETSGKYRFVKSDVRI